MVWQAAVVEGEGTTTMILWMGVVVSAREIPREVVVVLHGYVGELEAASETCRALPVCVFTAAYPFSESTSAELTTALKVRTKSDVGWVVPRVNTGYAERKD